MIKHSGIFSKALSLACCLALALSAVPAARAAEDGPVKSSNKNAQDYSMWASPVTSYLYENPDGGLTRVEYTGGQVVIEDYDSGFRYLSGRTIAPELPVWGGFFAGEDFNFLFFGQTNREESATAEVIRVVKYDKDWNRLGQASLKGANTTVPFDAGSLRCDEYGGYLYIRTSHEMFRSPDGYNHQANLTMAVRQQDMTITDSYFDVMNSSYGYISHSFNQFILVDEDGRVVALDHGDAHPRGVAFSKYYADASTGRFTGSIYSPWCISASLMDFAGATGANATGASLGGLAETEDCYIMAYNYDQTGSHGERYPYYHWMDKASGKSWSAQLTQTPGSTTPGLAPTGLEGGYMLWNGKSGYAVNDTLYYLPYGADGKPGEIHTAAGSLSDCPPIYYNGRVIWYTTSNSAPVFYQLDSSGVTAIPAGGAAPTFSDVRSSDWFKRDVEKVAAAGIMNGMGEDLFAPYGSLTIAQALKLAYELDSRATGGVLPQTGGAWYAPYYQYCLDRGIISAGQIRGNDFDRAATRFDMVEILDRAIPAGRMAAVVTVASIPDLAESAPHGGVVYKWYRAGILSGDDAGRFNGSSSITRAEVAAILCRINSL